MIRTMIILLCISLSLYPKETIFELYDLHPKYSHAQSSLKKVVFTTKHTTPEGIAIAIEREGILLERPHAPGTIFISHGFMCNKFDCGFLRLFFPNFNIFTFDFRAHGERVDVNQCCTFGRDEAQDLSAAVAYCKNVLQLKGLRIVYGFSMGAVAALMAQAEEPRLFDAMILDCPYDDSLNVIKKGLENWRIPYVGTELPGKGMLEQYAFNPWLQGCIKGMLKTIANMDTKGINTYIYHINPAQQATLINVPCLLIHCMNDEKVPVSAAYAIFNNLSGPKRLVLTAGRNHFDSLFYYPEQYYYYLNSFIDKLVNLTIYQDKKAKIIINPVAQSSTDQLPLQKESEV